MSSDSGSESDSNRSGGEESPNRTVAPTPGHGLDRSNSNSPDYGNKSQASPNRSRSRNSASSGSRSSSAASNHTKTGSRSRSPSAGSNKSGSGRSNKSAASNRSRSQSAGSGSHRSNSAGSNLSRSNRSGSRSRSGTPASNRSGSASNRSRSRSKSAESRRSGSGSERSRSRSKSHDRSGSNSPNLQIDEPHDDKNEKDDGGKEGVSAAAIFGDDADDISSEEEKEKSIASDREEEVQRRRSVDDVERVGPVSDEEPEPRSTVEEEEEKEAEPEPIPETRIDVEIPKISCDLGKDISFVKLPNFLSVETRPFDPETYEDEIDEEETLDEEGRARLKLKVENTIRWREIMDDEGNLKKESNARMVRWSDGSFSLHLGSEIFDVYRQPLQGDHNHLFIRQGTGLQGQAVFRTKLSFRPHSTESFTHRKMTISLADRSQKTSGIKILSQVGVDPDHDKATRLKKEEEKLRQTIRSSKPRRKGDGGVRSHNISNVYREEDGSDEDGAISLNAIKNKYKSSAHVAGIAAKGGAIYSSDEEGSDIEDRRNRKSDKAKALKDSDSGEESD